MYTSAIYNLKQANSVFLPNFGISTPLVSFNQEFLAQLEKFNLAFALFYYGHMLLENN